MKINSYCKALSLLPFFTLLSIFLATTADLFANPDSIAGEHEYAKLLAENMSETVYADTSPLTGDVDGDQDIDLTDTILALQIVSGADATHVNKLADVNSDNKIGIEEIIYTLQQLEGNQGNCENDYRFCTRLEVECGTASGIDDCGNERTVDECGTCSGPQSCSNGQCTAPGAIVGVNVSWFNTWNESQPLANVAPTGRGSQYIPLPLDQFNQPIDDFNLVIYEGSSPGEIGGAGGGAQTGAHSGRFHGQATLTGSGGTLSDVEYDADSNITTFTYTTTAAANSFVNFTTTRRFPADTQTTGITNLEIMRPGHDFEDLVNTNFVNVMEPFSAFRVGPNWGEWTYQVSAPVWSNRAKPDGFYSTADGEPSGGGIPWETLIAMANEMHIDLWICLPPNADDEYITNIFRVFYYGSDGVDPYTSEQETPVWAPLAPDRKLYFEIGNEIWNWANPYGSITAQVYDSAVAEIEAGDPNHYEYASADRNRAGRRKLALMTAKASHLCRNVVGDENMMNRYRPVLSGQSAWAYLGQNSISYLKCVLGGHDWYSDWSGDHFPGRYNPDVVKTPEDGVSINEFGNVARPITYWIYGYAVAPYINGDDIAALTEDLVSTKEDMVKNITIAREAGVEPLAYEGGIERYDSYDEAGLDTIIEDMLGYWYANGGGLFMYYALAGNSGSGLVPDMTRTDPLEWPKIRAVRIVSGIDSP